MKKFLLGFISLILLGLSGCNYTIPQVNNESTTDKIINYQDVDISSLQDGLNYAIEKAEQSVIAITHSDGSIIKGSTTLGSAVVIKRDGNDYWALTNRHVITDKSGNKEYIVQNVTIHLNGIELNGSTVEYNNSVDLAIIRFSYNGVIKVAEIADSTTIKRGNIVAAIGSPFNLSYYNSCTMGIVSYVLRVISDRDFLTGSTVNNQYIQHDAAISPGNSGGGLFDINGKLLGINTCKIWDESIGVENMSFAIPTEVIINTFPNYFSTAY